MVDRIDSETDKFMPNEPEHLRRVAADQVRRSTLIPIQERNSGASTRAARITGIELGGITRRSLMLNFLSKAGVAAGIAGGIAGGVEGGIQVWQNCEASEKQNFEISRKFAEYIAQVPYGERDPGKSYGVMTAGEQAVVDSMVHLRERNYGVLHAIHADLWRAVSVSTSYDAKCVALSRIAIDNSFLGEADLALQAISEIDFHQIRDDKLVIRLLDFGSSVALNAITPAQFATFSSPALSHLEIGWSRSNIAEDDPVRIAAMAKDFGIGVFTIAQRSALKKMRLGVESEASLRIARAEWFESLKEVMYHIDVGNSGNLFSEDYLYSLHRPIFHAAANVTTEKDIVDLRCRLDYYFGRDRPAAPVEDLLDVSRSMFHREHPGSSPWIFLLDIAAKADDSFEVARDEFTVLLDKSLKQNNHFKKAMVNLGEALDFDRQSTADALGVELSRLELPPTPMHQVYKNVAGVPVRLQK